MNNHRSYIEELANKALESGGCTKPPVPVEDIAKKIGLTVVMFDFPQTISGVLKKEKKAIGVNQNHHPLRRRFTVSHELGHFLLGHEGYKDEEFIDDRFDRPIPLEREANLFASFLLMPKKWVEESIKKNGMEIPRLAKEFQVSEQAMTIRLLELNLIK